MLRLCYCFYDCDSRRRPSEGAPAAHSSIEETLLVVGVESLLRLYTLRCGLLLSRQNLYASHQMRQAESVESIGDARYDTFSVSSLHLSAVVGPPPKLFLPNYYPRFLVFFLISTVSVHQFSGRRGKKSIFILLKWMQPGTCWLSTQASSTDAVGLNVHRRE